MEECKREYWIRETDVLDRRTFLKRAGQTTAAAVAISAVGTPIVAKPLSPPNRVFSSNWDRLADRTWIGPEYWANPLQDWRIRQRRLECFSAGGDRNVVLLTHALSDRREGFSTSVRIEPIAGSKPGLGFVGFRVGIHSHTDDFRANAIYGLGLNAGVCGDGRLFIGEPIESSSRIDTSSGFQLQLIAEPSSSEFRLTLRAGNGPSQVELQRTVPASLLIGSVGLVCSSGNPPTLPVWEEPKDFRFYPPQQRKGGTLMVAFSDWKLDGAKVDSYPERAFGPILFTSYTVNRKVLKLSSQLPPVDSKSPVSLEVRDENNTWKRIGTAVPDQDAWNALFRIPNWDDSRDWDYRVRYALDGQGEHFYLGSIRRNPINNEDFVIGLLTCVWDYGFPHTDFSKNFSYHRPDLLLWTGDQIYESVGGFGVIESREAALLDPAMLDFLRKWFIFGWAMRDLMRDIPSVCMTDDHDMYHGNIWGCKGRPTNPAAGFGAAGQDSGGYKMPARWVNMVQRAQTAQLPDPFDPSPVEQGISVYYTSLLWGGVSLAILEDRKWKSAPKEMLPDAKIENGFAMNPDWITANLPPREAELLGDRQLAFLKSWAQDWSEQAWMKFAVSQTIFGCLHTEPKGYVDDDHDPDETVPTVGEYVQGDHQVADHDTGSWPQPGRNTAVGIWRTCFAAHLCGDQHLGSTSHYGIDEFRDGVYSICTPAISSIWPRRFFPPQDNDSIPTAEPRYTGDYLDGFGNRMSVLAVANPARYPGSGLEGLRLRATGYTILSCNRRTRETTITQWPRWIDPGIPGAKPYAGWPLTVRQMDNGLWGARWELPLLEISEVSQPVIQVRSQPDDVILYTLRVAESSVRLPVRSSGQYTVIAFDPDGSFRREWRDLEARLKGS